MVSVLRSIAAACTVVLGVAFTATALGGTAHADEECAVRVHNPHASSHVPGTTNVVADLTCRSAKPHIGGNINIQKESPNPGYWEVLNTGFGGRDNTRTLSINTASDECVNGSRYRAFAQFSYTTDGVNTIVVEGRSPEVTISGCP